MLPHGRARLDRIHYYKEAAWCDAKLRILRCGGSVHLSAGSILHGLHALLSRSEWRAYFAARHIPMTEALVRAERPAPLGEQTWPPEVWELQAAWDEAQRADSA